jgi:hypothetical protein
MLGLPILSAPDVSDPRLEGRLLARERRLFKPDVSRAPGLLGDLGEVKGVRPLGGLEVRTTGGLAGSSSRGTSSSCNCFSDGCE